MRCPRCNGNKWVWVPLPPKFDDVDRSDCPECNATGTIPDEVVSEVVVPAISPERELFEMVYQWGKVGIITDEHCPAYLAVIKKVKGTK